MSQEPANFSKPNSISQYLQSENQDGLLIKDAIERETDSLNSVNFYCKI